MILSISTVLAFQAFHAVFFRFPPKLDVAPQTVIQWKTGRARHLAGPSACDSSWVCIRCIFNPFLSVSTVLQELNNGRRQLLGPQHHCLQFWWQSFWIHFLLTHFLLFSSWSQGSTLPTSNCTLKQCTKVLLQPGWNICTMTAPSRLIQDTSINIQFR